MIVYGKNVDGTFNQPDVFPGLVPRTGFCDLFFYDDDKFISMSTANKVNMHALYKFKNMIAVDAEGVLWSAPISTAGYLGSLNKIGTGWNRFRKLVTVGDLLLAMDENGDFWKFNFDTDHYWVTAKP